MMNYSIPQYSLNGQSGNHALSQIVGHQAGTQAFPLNNQKIRIPIPQNPGVVANGSGHVDFGAVC